MLKKNNTKFNNGEFFLRKDDNLIGIVISILKNIPHYYHVEYVDSTIIRYEKENNMCKYLISDRIINKESKSHKHKQLPKITE